MTKDLSQLSTINKNGITWIAHRGYSGRYIENTLPAMQAAIEAGALFLETDIQFSQDLQPVLFHDVSLRRLTGQPEQVFDYTFNQLAELKLRMRDKPDVFGVAHLEQLLELLSEYPRVSLYLEIKEESIAHFGMEATLTRLYQWIKPFEQQLVLISFSLEILKYMCALGYSRLAPVIRTQQQIHSKALLELKPESVFINYRRIRDFTELAQLDFPVMVYEVSDPVTAKQLFRQGISVMETDHIGDMIKVRVEE